MKKIPTMEECVEAMEKAIYFSDYEGMDPAGWDRMRAPGRRRYRRAARAALAGASEAGFALVPKEATDEMVAASPGAKTE